MKKELIVEYSRIAIFAALWAVVEVFLGNYLHQIHLPFKGLVLTLTPIILFSVALFYLKGKFSVMYIGIVVALIRMVWSWKFNIFVILAIIMQALLANISVLIFRKSIITVICMGVLLESWTFFQRFFYRVIFMGSDLKSMFDTLKDYKVVADNLDNIVMLLIIIYILHIVPGMVAGVAGYITGRKLSENED
jgi:hypothetical protein